MLGLFGYYWQRENAWSFSILLVGRECLVFSDAWSFLIRLARRDCLVFSDITGRERLPGLF